MLSNNSLSTQHAQYVLLSIILAVNFKRFQMLLVTHPYSSRPFLCTLSETSKVYITQPIHSVCKEGIASFLRQDVYVLLAIVFMQLSSYCGGSSHSASWL